MAFEIAVYFLGDGKELTWGSSETANKLNMLSYYILVRYTYFNNLIWVGALIDLCTLQVIVFERGDLVFVFNFHPENTYDGYACFLTSEVWIILGPC